MEKNKNEIGHDICQEVKMMSLSIKKNFILMAEKLKKIRDEKLYIGGGHETFWQFCEEDCEMSESSVSKMITTYEKLVLKFGISPAKLLKSWNSAYLIASACETKEQAEDLLEKNLVPSELKKELADMKSGGECKHLWNHVEFDQCKKCNLKQKNYDEKDN
jgi:hypothetical protein